LEQLQQLLLSQLQGGNAPDLFQAQPGRPTPTSVWPLAEANRLLDLFDRPWVGDIFPPAKKYVTYKDKIYGWPLGVSVREVVYNTELFARLGLQVPTTQRELLDLCRKVKAAGKIPIAQAFVGATSSVVLQQALQASYIYSLDPDWTEKRESDQVTFTDSPLWKSSFGSVVAMKNAGFFQPNPSGTTVDEMTSLLARDKAVMSVLATPQIPAVTKINPDWKYSVFPLPGLDAQDTNVAVSGSDSISGNAQTKHPDEVRMFMDFIAQPEQSALYAAAGGSIAPADLASGKLPGYLDGVAPYFEQDKLIFSPQNAWPNPAFLTTVLAPGINGLITGQRDVNALLKELDAKWNP
jgi:raffinose/stachyose/melibiose transport system substrate-binding protein